MTRHDFGTCRITDCPTCEHEAEHRTHDHDADPYGWQADIAADRYERTVLGL